MNNSPPNFGRLVLFCIEADFCIQRRILQHFSRSTRFVNLCTAPNSTFADFLQNFRKDFGLKFCEILELFGEIFYNRWFFVEIRAEIEARKIVTPKVIASPSPNFGLGSAVDKLSFKSIHRRYLHQKAHGKAMISCSNSNRKLHWKRAEIKDLL